MTASGIPALLEPIQKRLNAGPSYEWGCQIGGIIYPHTYEADALRDARFEGNSQRIAVKRIRPGKWVDADTPAPTDTARLLAAVQAVEEWCLNLDAVEKVNPSSSDNLNASAGAIANVLRKSVAAALRGEA